MEVEHNNHDSENNDFNKRKRKRLNNLPAVNCSENIIHDVKWIGNPVVQHKQRTYYTAAKVGK